MSAAFYMLSMNKLTGKYDVVKNYLKAHYMLTSLYNINSRHHRMLDFGKGSGEKNWCFIFSLLYILALDHLIFKILLHN